MRIKDEAMERFKDMQRRLRDITEPCRYDMHEPDEQGVSAIVTGKNFDNALGDHGGGPELGAGQELVLIISRDVGTATRSERFNLATLVALAREAALDGPDNRKETSPRISSIAARYTRGEPVSHKEILSCMMSLIGQDETKGQG